MVVEAAARIDLAGGWSDTPPITYEHGGAVTNAAIIINGKRPIGARVRRISQAHLVLVVDTAMEVGIGREGHMSMHGGGGGAIFMHAREKK